MIQKAPFIHFMSLTLLLTFHLQAAGTLFSPFNRYDLSFLQLESRRQRIIDTALVPWLSLYDSCCGSDINSGFRFEVKGQSIDVDLGGLAGLEYFSKSSRFGVIRGGIDYASTFLRAHITTDVYSTEHRADLPVGDIQFERFIKKGATVPITGLFDFRFNLPEAYLQTGYKMLSLSIGKQKLRWGPGYKGTLSLSGTAFSPFYFYHLNLKFGTLFNMAAFLCGYDDESIYRSELITTDTVRVIANNVNLKSFFPRYGAGQRLDIRLGRHLQIGLYELVDFFGSNELNRFANPLQIYYLSNEASGTNNSNLLGGMDFNLIFNRIRIYGELLNDDITVMEHTGNPNKYAFQLGGAFYGKDPLIQTGIEYTHVTRYVYSHSRVLSRHAHWGESMGWPWGNYQDLFTVYSVFRFPHNINGKVEGNLWIKGDGAIEDDWYVDGKPDLDQVPYWPRNASTIFSGILSAEYAPFPWLTYTFYWEPVVQHRSLNNGFYTYLMLNIPGKHVVKVH